MGNGPECLIAQAIKRPFELSLNNLLGEIFVPDEVLFEAHTWGDVQRKNRNMVQKEP